LKGRGCYKVEIFPNFYTSLESTLLPSLLDIGPGLEGTDELEGIPWPHVKGLEKARSQFFLRGTHMIHGINSDEPPRTPRCGYAI